MPLYECVLIARNDVTQQQVEGIADGIASQLETEGGAVKKREYWGLRGLAYRIKKNRKGHYMLLGLDAKPAFITEMERQLGLNEDILRFMTIRVAEIEEAPSAILSRKSDDRERSFRGPKPAGRFDSGRRRGFDEREEFRARDEFRRGISRRRGGVSHVRNCRNQSGRPPRRRRRPPAVLPPPQVLPVLRPECAEDRLQGRAPAVPLPVGARQDRAQPHHRGLGQEAARAGGGDQARPLPRLAALHRELTERIMADVELILLQRVEKLGQMGDLVKVRPGFARNYLLPQKKALRASKDNLARFEQERAQLEAQNLKRREEAERVAERVTGLSVVIIRQAGESGSLYGSVSARDVAEATTAAGLTVNRQQVLLEHPIKTLGLARVRVALHPEVSIPVIVNVARSQEEAERQARGERVGAEAEEEEGALDAAALFEPGAAPEQPPV